MKVVKIIFSIIFSIMFAISVIMTAFLGITNKTISQDYIMSKLKESNIYEEIQDKVQEKVDIYLENNSESAEILNEFATSENIENVIESVSDSIYQNDDFDFSSEGLQEILNENIDKIKVEQNIEISDAQQQKINEFVKEISDEYEESFNNLESSNDSENLENLESSETTEKIGNSETLESSENLESSETLENSENFYNSENPKNSELVSNDTVEFINNVPNMLKIVKNMYSVMIVFTIFLAIFIILINLKSLTSGIDFIASGLIVSGIGLVGTKNIFNIFIEKSKNNESFQDLSEALLVFVKIYLVHVMNLEKCLLELEL
jgi:hypothetical protein